MVKYVQPGSTIDFVNNGEAVIKAGDVVTVGNHVGIAGSDIAIGEVGALAIEGVFEFEKDDAEIQFGTDVYLVDGKVTATKAEDSNSSSIGFAIAPASANDTTVRVKLT